MKYIVVEDRILQFPVVFGEDVSHRFMAAKLSPLPARSAGFCTLDGTGLTVHGRSESLDLDPHPEDRDLLMLALGLITL